MKQTFSDENGEQFFPSGSAPQKMLKEVSDSQKIIPGGSLYMWKDMKSTEKRKPEDNCKSSLYFIETVLNF